MPQLKLTKANVEKVAKPGLSASDLLFWDTETKGFGLRVSPKGKSTFVAQARVNGIGDAVRVTIGPFGVFTPDQAREAAKEHLRSMNLGTDPRDVKRHHEAMKVTLQDVCDAYTSRPGKLKPGSATEIKRYVEKAFASWKDKPIANITEGDVRKRHREIMEGDLNGKRAAPSAANSAMVILRTLINFAARQYRRADGTPLIQHNPVGVMIDHWAKVGTRTDRYIDKRKIGEVWNALRDARTKPSSQDALAGIDLTIFLMLTGARRMEGAALTWDRVNIDDQDQTNCWWHLPDPKNGKAVWLPLPSQAVELLKARKPEVEKDDDEDDEPSSYVFASRSQVGHITDTRAPMAMVSKVAGKRLSAHDLRRTFTNVAMRECLIEKFRTDLLTNHVPDQADVTARNYLDLSRLDWLHPEVQKIADWIEEQARIAAAKAGGGNVVPIRA